MIPVIPHIAAASERTELYISANNRVVPQMCAPAARSTIVSAIGGVLSLLAFVVFKMLPDRPSVGWVLLPAFALCVATVLVQLRHRIRIHASAVPLLCFSLYFIVRLALDCESWSEVAGFAALSYQNGVGFGLVTGIGTRVLLLALFSDGIPRRQIRRIAITILGLHLLSCLYMAWTLWNAAEAGSPLLVLSNDSYQTTGSVLVLDALIVVCIAEASTRRGTSRAAVMAILLLATSTLVSLMLISQFLGSNAGTACTAGVALVLGLVGVGRVLAVSISQLSRFWIVLALIALVTVAIRLEWGSALMDPGIDSWLSRFRLFGFGSGLLNTTVTSRLEMAENFPTQFADSPVFGNFLVDRTTTGAGTYIHSLLSMLPHLGLVGTALFVIYICVAVREHWLTQRLSRDQQGLEMRNSPIDLLLLAWIFLFATVVVFFTWTPLWFAIGLLVPPISISRRKARTRSLP